jgi:hypothetical protein
MGGLLLALIVIAAFGLVFWTLEAEDWSRMRHGHLPRPSMGAVGPWMRDVLHWRGDEAQQPSPNQVTGPESLRQPKVSSPPATPAHPQVAPAPPKPPEPSVEASVYDRLYGGPRSVRKEERDD